MNGEKEGVGKRRDVTNTDWKKRSALSSRNHFEMIFYSIVYTIITTMGWQKVALKDNVKWLFSDHSILT